MQKSIKFIEDLILKLPELFFRIQIAFNKNKLF